MPLFFVNQLRSHKPSKLLLFLDRIILKIFLDRRTHKMFLDRQVHKMFLCRIRELQSSDRQQHRPLLSLDRDRYLLRQPQYLDRDRYKRLQHWDNHMHHPRHKLRIILYLVKHRHKPSHLQGSDSHNFLLNFHPHKEVS